jgi:hypothetical protein
MASMLSNAWGKSVSLACAKLNGVVKGIQSGAELSCGLFFALILICYVHPKDGIALPLRVEIARHALNSVLKTTNCADCDVAVIYNCCNSLVNMTDKMFSTPNDSRSVRLAVLMLMCDLANGITTDENGDKSLYIQCHRTHCVLCKNKLCEMNTIIDKVKETYGNKKRSKVDNRPRFVRNNSTCPEVSVTFGIKVCVECVKAGYMEPEEYFQMKCAEVEHGIDLLQLFSLCTLAS